MSDDKTSFNWKIIKERVRDDRSANLTSRNGNLSVIGISGALTLGVINYSQMNDLIPIANYIAGSVASTSLLLVQLSHARKNIALNNLLSDAYDQMDTEFDQAVGISTQEYKALLKEYTNNVPYKELVFNLENSVSTLAIIASLGIIVSVVSSKKSALPSKNQEDVAISQTINPTKKPSAKPPKI